MATELSIQKISANQIRLSWPTKAGYTYQVQRSQTLGNDWLDVGLPVTGDGTVKTNTQPINGQQWFYRLFIELPQGSEPPLQLITYFNQLRVLLLWEPFGPHPTGQYQIFRDNNLLAVATAESDAYFDTTVQSGKHYTYTVKYYSTT